MATFLTEAMSVAIDAAIERLLERAKARFLGPKAGPKEIIIGFKPRLSLPGIYVQGAAAEGARPDKKVEAQLIQAASNYFEAYKAATKARVIRNVQAFMDEASDKGIPTNAHVVLGGELAETFARVTNDVKRLVETEGTRARNMGVLEGIVGVNKSLGEDDPVVFWICVHDEYLCKECKRLHLLPDEITPRAWRLSEVGSGFHKKGDNNPKIGGLHPNERCHMATLLKGYGFDMTGRVKFISPDHDEFARQRALVKSERFQKSESGAPETWYHITDNPKFALNPDFAPEDNSISLHDRGGQKGIYLTTDPQKWVNGHNYVRPYIAEFKVHPSLKTAAGVHGKYSGEMFVPAAHYDKAQLNRVIPIDAHAREVFGEHGWIETHHGAEFDTGKPIVPPGSNGFAEGKAHLRSYRYSGPDVRAMTPEQHAHHDARWRSYMKENRGIDLDAPPEDDLEKSEDLGEALEEEILEKKTPPTFPGVGVPDDRKETDFVTPAQQELKHAAVINSAVRNTDPDDWTQRDAYFNRGPEKLKERSKNIHGASWTMKDAQHSYAKDIAGPSTVLHENLHNLFGRVEQQHGAEARTNLARNILWSLPVGARISAYQLADFWNPSRRMHEEEALSYMISYLNDKQKRGEFHDLQSHGPMYRNEFDRDLKEGYRHLMEVSSKVTPEWLVDGDWQKRQMKHTPPVDISTPEKKKAFLDDALRRSAEHQKLEQEKHAAYEQHGGDLAKWPSEVRNKFYGKVQKAEAIELEELKKHYKNTSDFIRAITGLGWQLDRNSKHIVYRHPEIPEGNIQIQHSHAKGFDRQMAGRYAKQAGLSPLDFTPDEKGVYAHHYRRLGFLQPLPEEGKPLTWKPATPHELVPIDQVMSSKPELEDWRVARAKALLPNPSMHGRLQPVRTMKLGDQHHIIDGDEEVSAAKELGYTHVPVAAGT